MKTIATFALSQPRAQQYTPKIPKVWDEAMVASMELPPAPPGAQLSVAVYGFVVI